MPLTIARARKEIADNLKVRDRLLGDFVKRLNGFMADELEKAVRDLGESPRAQDVARVLGTLEERFRAAGLNDEVTRLAGIYRNELSTARREVGRIAETEGGGSVRPTAQVSNEIVRQLVEYDIDRVGSTISTYINDARSNLARQVLLGERPTAKDFIDTENPRLEANLNTELQTSLQGFNRSVVVGEAKELGFDLYLYIGPDDNLTRPFCNDVLSKDPPIYTLDEIDSLDNEQGLAVITYGGGYNCRHQWRPVSEETARELGWTPE
jgi:hypothetical protein